MIRNNKKLKDLEQRRHDINSLKREWQSALKQVEAQITENKLSNLSRGDTFVYEYGGGKIYYYVKAIEGESVFCIIVDVIISDDSGCVEYSLRTQAVRKTLLIENKSCDLVEFKENYKAALSNLRLNERKKRKKESGKTE